MNDQITPSGSRWEPDGDETPAPTSEAPVEPYGGPAVETHGGRLRGRAVLAGAATALTLGGGLAGFVIGHATGSDDGFRPANFSQQRPGGQRGDQFGGRQGDGHQGPPSFRSGDGDREDHGSDDAPSGTAGSDT